MPVSMTLNSRTGFQCKVQQPCTARAVGNQAVASARASPKGCAVLTSRNAEFYGGQANLFSAVSSIRHRACRRGRLSVQNVIPQTQGDASSQLPPDLPSFLFKERIVYMGMTLVPAVTELILAELLYLQYEDANKPVFFYINSTGTTKEGQKMGYDTEAMAIYDTMKYVNTPIHTLCVGNAWGEAALLLAAGEKGYRAALPSATIMLKQPITMFKGQATDIEIQRQEIRKTKTTMLELLAKETDVEVEKLEKDTNRPLYLAPDQAVDYGVIDKVLTGEN